MFVVSVVKSLVIVEFCSLVTDNLLSPVTFT